MGLHSIAECNPSKNLRFLIGNRFRVTNARLLLLGDVCEWYAVRPVYVSTKVFRGKRRP